MKIAKSGTNVVYCRCYDAALSATPTYRMQIFSRESDIYQTLTLTDSSANKPAFQKFSIAGNTITVNPGTYHYKIIDAGDSNRTLERGRVTITASNHTTHEHEPINTITSHAIPD